MDVDRDLAIRRHPERGRHEREIIDAILDEAPICHVGFVVDGQPFVMPTIHARDGNTLYLHGSNASRMARRLAEGIPACVTVTLLDGLVMARTVFDHSMNYRSVVVLGSLHEVTDRDQKLRGLRAVVEHVAPGRWDEARQPNDKEMKATSLLAMVLDRTSAKIRTGPPKDDPEDLSFPVWAGVVPMRLAPGDPIPDAGLDPALEISGSVRRYLDEHA
jgi:nitroimidazol reductase NimA-like FMN-containing flavoprotein (pyridoxamine 5'-phosphate oxidase superfamily)